MEREGKRREDPRGRMIKVSWWSVNEENVWRFLVVLFMAVSSWTLNNIVELKANAITRTELTAIVDKIDRNMAGQLLQIDTKLNHITQYLLEKKDAPGYQGPAPSYQRPAAKGEEG